MNYQLSFQQMRADLIWAITSPSLMSYEHNLSALPTTNELRRWLDAEEHEALLHRYMEERRPSRLGIYFEVLWQYFLEQSSAFDLITRNLPVRRDGQTLGEFDFIYFCRQRQRYIHLETAVKFYLGVAGSSQRLLGWQQWIGPGRKDRLDIKLAKMLDKQTQLAQTPEGAEIVEALGISNLVPEICLKGYFFYPLGADCCAPRDANESHLRGFWLKLKQLEQLPPNRQWIILDKQSWLAPAEYIEAQDGLEYSALKRRLNDYFATNQFPVMLALLTPCGQRFQEQARYFITPDDWPNRHD